ncbi:RidA family protein [Acetobacteraceae bacterium H6797]|nr:RidA family protein [Acetobacteraceae bacterium H6797]
MVLPIRHKLAGFPPTISPSSHAVEAGGFVYFTGLLGRDLADPAAPLPEGVAAQVSVALGSLRKGLEGLGLGMENLVSVRVYLTEFERDYEAMNAAYAGCFAEDARPVRTCVGVVALARGALVELDAVAWRG